MGVECVGVSSVRECRQCPGRLRRPSPSSFAGADALGLPSLAQAIKGEDITVYGEGQQTRSFCYVDDLVDGLIRLMNQEVCCRGAAPTA